MFRLASALFLLPCSALAAPVPLVQGGATEYVLYFEAGAPSSVAQGAAELQHYLRRATGASAAIVHTPRSPMICLGDNAAAGAAGLSAKGIPVEGFRIVTKGANLFILGPDTRDDGHTPGGGFSAGTRNGVYAFLERFVGVRWLTPGEHGDFVPKTRDVMIPQTDVVDAPFFLNRRLPYIQENRPDVKRWRDRQRLGASVYLNHGHNWKAVKPEAFDRHPGWFAERGGVRVPPVGRYKLCITNPGLVDAFAAAALAFFRQNPQATCFSLSPSDSGGWCECANCRRLYEKDPNGDLSVTPAVLTFYNEVAKRVAKVFPHKHLAGYVYSNYVFPPRKPGGLHPNVWLVWAPSFDYGFTLFRPRLQAQWSALLAEWTAVTHNLSYYDLPTKIITETGALNPPGLKILHFLYPRLKEAGIKGVYVYGVEAWGRGGPLNYLLAKLAWDPDADVDALFDEYCAKAYGAGGTDINRLFRLLDAEMERHYRQFPDERSTLTDRLKEDVYARNWQRLETLYSAAERKTTDPDARARLQMIGDNLTVLHWNLRRSHLLTHPERSPFYLTDADFYAFVSRHLGSLSLHPLAARKTPAFVKAPLKVAPVRNVPNAEPVRPFLLRGNQHLVLCPLDAGAIEVHFRRLTQRGKLVTYAVYDSTGKVVSQGAVTEAAPATIPAPTAPWYHLVVTGGGASFTLAVRRAAWAVDQRSSEQGLHLLGKVTPVYFHVPPGTKSFSLSLAATPPGETCLASLFSPTGREVADFDCTAVSVDRKVVTVPPKEAGWWKVVLKRAPVGVMDDVWLQVGADLSGFFSLAPAQALQVD